MLKEYKKFVEEQINNKKHIVITGGRGSGKTTLLNAIRTDYVAEKFGTGIVTWAEPGKAVFMRELGSTESVMIGEFDPNSVSVENRMKAVPEGFGKKGVYILDSLINSDSEWVTIDEIGYLEGTCSSYLNKLNELFDKKRVMAVLRKQDIKHINDIIRRDDVYKIDLDYVKEK